MGLLLPCLLALLLFDALRRALALDDNRETLCITALALGIFVAISTEILNVFHWLTPLAAWFTWSAACLAVLALRFSRLKFTSPTPRASLRSVVAEADWLSLIIAATIFVFVVVTGLVAWAAVPNNYDSMTYHLARVIHWRQDHSIDFYPTANSRQNASPPLAEWTILQLTLLDDSARSANLLQWFSYLGCIAGVSLLTERLGAAPRTGLIAALFAATLPSAVLEATSTQNDLVAAFWLVCLAHGCLQLQHKISWRAVFIISAAAGLGLLTKTVFLIYLAPFLVWAGVLLLRDGFRPATARLVVMGTFMLLLNLGHFSRNAAISGNPFGPSLDPHSHLGSETNSSHTPAALAENVLRNLALHAIVGGHTAQDFAVRLHRWLGLDPNDPRTTSFIFRTFFLHDYGEDGGPMPFHVAVALLVFSVLLVTLRREQSTTVHLAFSIIAGALLFCLILRWQPFHTRLHLPLLILSAPIIGLVLQHRSFRFAAVPLLLLLTATTVPKVFAYNQRPAFGANSVFIAPPDEQQYAHEPELREPYVRAIELLSEHHVHAVGFISAVDDCEYPLAAYGNFHSLWRTDHVLLPGGSPPPAEIPRDPDALVCTRPGFGDTVHLRGRTFTRIYSHVAHPTNGAQPVPVSVYLPADSQTL